MAESDPTIEATFTFVDLAGFTALTETHGDDAAASLVMRFHHLVSAAAEPDARVVSVIGDGAFLVSDAPVSAVRMITRLVTRLHLEPDFPEVRAGLHHGMAAARDGQFYGTAVNIAARIAGYARGGQVLCSSTVANAVGTIGLAAESLGVVSMKNLREPIEVFLLATSATEQQQAIDPVCRMRVSPSRIAVHLELEGVDYWFCSRTCLEIFLTTKG
jgi:adenylate cyclase